MKGIFIAYDQAYNMEIADAIEALGVRGFTMWQDIAGRGGFSGEPHLGNHAWPTMNNAMLTFVPDERWTISSRSSRLWTRRHQASESGLLSGISRRIINILIS